MSFSLSPSVQITENDLSVSIPNLPSSKTGMILRADTGPCNKIIALTSEAQLVGWFGKPTAANYKDWFNAWNFLQYASNLYVVRPTYVDEAGNTSVKNAGVKLTGENYSTDASQENLFNSDVAEITLQNDADFTSERVFFFNRNVTSNQKIGLAVCSSSTHWKSPIANEFSAVVTLGTPTDPTYATSKIKNLSDIGSIINDSPNSQASISLDFTSVNTLKVGSKFNGNGKLFTVKSISENATNSTKTVTVNSLNSVVAGDLSVYYGTIATGGGHTSSTLADTETLTFDKTKRFNIDTNAVFEFISGTDSALYYVSAVTVNGVVTLKKANNTAPSANYVISDESELVSNSTFNHFTLSSDYNGIVPTGTSVLKVDPDFYFPVDSSIKFQFSSASGGYYGSLVTDIFPNENGTDVDNYVVVAVDTVNNIITLDRALIYPVEIASDTQVADIVSTPTIIKGVNLHTTVYDSSAITTTKQTLIDATDNQTKVFVIESLIKFSDTQEYEPSWVNDEFVTVVLQKNVSGLYEVVEINLASYNPTARDIQNRNMFANEIFFYASNYLYCKVNDDDTLMKVTTANGPLVKFVSTYGTVGIVTDGYAPVVEFGTVYPLVESTSTPNVYKIGTDGNFIYDANNYTQGDVQNATDKFSDSELFDVNILVAHELDINGMSEVAETRKDCVAIIAPYVYVDIVGKSASAATAVMLNKYGSQTVSDAKEFTRNGTYSAVYGNMKYQYDKFNDVNRWVSLGGDIAGIMANTDTNKDPWWAPAGLERGKVKNAIKLAFNPNKANRDDLYVNAINPVISIVGEGAAIVYGQKTAIARPSALDRLNVRRLLIVIEKAIATAVKYAIFEQNDSFTRNRLVGIIDPFLRTVKARRGVADYMVQCDATNQTADINTMVIDVYIKPVGSVEFITINMNLTRKDASFSEIVGGAGQ